jgi:hypothetical protein
MASCLFEEMVAQPLRADQGRSASDFPLPKYDLDRAEYVDRSWVAKSAFETHLAFVRLMANGGKFDLAEFAVLDLDSHRRTGDAVVSVDSCAFAYVRFTPSGASVLDAIVADE